jgi:hypothetical protein
MTSQNAQYDFDLGDVGEKDISTSTILNGASNE